MFSAAACHNGRLQSILAEDKGKVDAEVAQQLSGLELRERMIYAKLKSLKRSVPGIKSRCAVVELAMLLYF